MIRTLMLFLVKDNNLFLSSRPFLSQHVYGGYGKHVWLRQICYWDSFSHVSVTNQILTTFVFLFFFLSSLIFFSSILVGWCQLPFPLTMSDHLWERSRPGKAH